MCESNCESVSKGMVWFIKILKSCEYILTARESLPSRAMNATKAGAKRKLENNFN